MTKPMIFFDLDETIFDHHDNSHYWYHELESYLMYLKIKYALTFGIITGANFFETKKKIKALNMKLWPDFIAVGFGTDIYHRTNTHYLLDFKWRSQQQAVYNKNTISMILSILEKNDIKLVKEAHRSENNLKDSFYYLNPMPHITTTNQMKIKLIRLLCYKYKIKVIISQCNPNIGDPKNAFDVDFIPRTCGKENVAKYLVKKHDIAKPFVFAFGDSENDLSLLKSVQYGYAVSNATSNLKKYITNQCKYDHAQGILDSLIKHFGNLKK